MCHSFMALSAKEPIKPTPPAADKAPKRPPRAARISFPSVSTSTVPNPTKPPNKPANRIPKKVSSRAAVEGLAESGSGCSEESISSLESEFFSCMNEVYPISVEQKLLCLGESEKQLIIIALPSRANILHVDMDAFFVAVEVRHNPKLANLPVVVGGTGRRGVVAAASYEARAFGIFSAMPTARARQLCPDAVFLSGNFARYNDVSSNIMALFADVTPLVEPLSLDEAFLDVSGAGRFFGSPPEIAKMLRAKVEAHEQLRCSVGVGQSKLVAKIASQQAKPKINSGKVCLGDGVKVVEPEEESSFLRPLPVRRLWGVGAKTAERLNRFGVRTVGDLADLPLPALVPALGVAQAQHLHALANGRDDRKVEPQQKVKSKGVEETFPVDIFDYEQLRKKLLGMADSIASSLRNAGLLSRTVTLKIRFSSFETITRSETLAIAVNNGPTIFSIASRLLATVDTARSVRLLGISCSNLVTHSAGQLSLLDYQHVDGNCHPKSERRRSADSQHGLPLSSKGIASPSSVAQRRYSRAGTDCAIDKIRERFGFRAIGPARTVDGVSSPTREEKNPWGPDELSSQKDLL